MEVNIKKIPREFKVGVNGEIVLKDCGDISLNPNEQVTFITQNKKEYDVCCKEWGFYATPSVNGRLLKFGFKTALVESPSKMKYVWLVEEGKEHLFDQYLNLENHRVIEWLSNCTERMNCICGTNDFELVSTYSEPPLGEMPYNLNGKPYHRELMQCKFCGHYLAKHDYVFEDMYSGQYVQSTYQDKTVQTFNKIINLPSGQSDNTGRVNNIIEYCNKYFGNKSLSVLDVGSGLCVFLYLLSQKTDWTLLALDPDPAQSRHAEEYCKIPSICCDFQSFKSDKQFDLITFNKVLEHVKDPVQLLSSAKKNLSSNGLIYVELPDGTAAFKDSPLREEFFIEHYHAFSMASIGLLIEKAGLFPLHIERLREPSGKYTLRIFCTQ